MSKLKSIGIGAGIALGIVIVGEIRDLTFEAIQYGREHIVERANATLLDYGYEPKPETLSQSLRDKIINDAINSPERLTKINPDLVRALIHGESNGKTFAESGAGAIGLMQVMPFNAKHCGLESSRELWVEEKNIHCGVKILDENLARYDGDVISALAAYNGGHERVAKPVKETLEHRKRVLDFLAKGK